MRLEASGIKVWLKRRAVLNGLDLAADRGQLTAVIGANGAGKTTLLRVLAGLLPAAAGEGRLDGRALAAWPRPQLARTLAYLPQERTIHWALSARSVVALGRLPHRALGQGESAADRAAIARAITTMDIGHLAERPVSDMSGGEKARVLMARALAQEPRVLIADEPAAGLDPAHQLALFRHFVTFATSGRTVLVALHDLSLAARFCHKIVLVHAGRALAAGPPEEVLTPPQLAAAYGIAAEYRTIDGLPVVLPFDVLP
ncbi:MAG TPA: ABC transporter ATP-binding protein [Hyphomicrobiaceae bacterium]|nr:ABC transporter ATP-binding protein [Hyphomicrobiaceae bacterium]